MVALDCNVVTCIHNAEHCCCKGDIYVEGNQAKKADQTCCGSFDERKGDAFHNSFESPDRLIGVECEAVNCIHNDDCICIADHIDIAGHTATEPEDTRCASFYPR